MTIFDHMMMTAERAGRESAEARLRICETALRQARAVIENALLASTMVLVDSEDDPGEAEFFYCRTEWDGLASIESSAPHDGKPHRCVHPAGHEHEEPHYCRCGAEL